MSTFANKYKLRRGWGNSLSKQIKPSKFTKDIIREVKNQREQVKTIIDLNFHIIEKSYKNSISPNEDK